MVDTSGRDVTAEELGLDASQGEPFVRDFTLCQVVDGDRILLGMKKRGFGVGKWNGFGGKVEKGETAEAAASRELSEEAGLQSRVLQHRGVLLFSFQGSPKLMRVHMFLTRFSDCDGEVTESEEMRPEWFPVSGIPFDKMWADDELWMGRVLEGDSVEGRFAFATDPATILHSDMHFMPADRPVE